MILFDIFNKKSKIFCEFSYAITPYEKYLNNTSYYKYTTWGKK